jgi:putative addiction module component (TIGR02574 family)
MAGAIIESARVTLRQPVASDTSAARTELLGSPSCQYRRRWEMNGILNCKKRSAPYYAKNKSSLTPLIQLWENVVPVFRCYLGHQEGDMKASTLLDEAISLPVEERAHLVDCLLQTLNPPDESHAVAWTEVARRRLDDLKSGKVAAISGEQVFARIRQSYGK